MDVRFHVIRHGEKNGDELTALGREQVRASAKKNFAGIKFHAAFYSGMERARQTAKIVLQTCEQVMPIEAEEGFGYEWALSPQWPIEEARKRLPEEPVVNDWLRLWWPAKVIRVRFSATLIYRAWMLGKERLGEDGVINVLVGSHSPTGDLAVLDPKVARPLAEAQVISYTVDPTTLSIVHCGFVG